MTPKPQLIVIEEPRPVRNLGTVTWEQRRQMTAAQLIELMGPLWVNHPDFHQYKPRSLLPMPNLVGRRPAIEPTERSNIIWNVKVLLQWIFR